MNQNNQNQSWEDVKKIWNNSSDVQEIKINVASFITELEQKVSTFEKETIKRDVQLIKDAVSEFERETIKKDIVKIHNATTEFERELMKKVTRFFKKIILRFKGK